VSDPGTTPPHEAGPAEPQIPPNEGTRVDALAAWIGAHRDAFTDAALERSAVGAGYTAEEFAAAAKQAAATSDRSALDPIKSSARRGVLIAYGIVWLVFAVAYLGRSFQYGVGPILQGILTIALGIGLGLSLLVIRYAQPDPERRSRAMALLLAAPVILLIGVAGTCLPFVTVQ
jgi:hypothetical protein